MRHALLALTLLLATNAAAQTTVWNFDNTAAPLAGSGPGTLAWRADTASVARLGTSGFFGLPPMTGGHTGVLSLPALSAPQGLYCDHNTPPNGLYAPQGWVSNYTLAFDILIPAATFDRWRSLCNTNLSNGNDGDAFINPSGALGISGQYAGTLRPATWHRVVLTFSAGAVLHKYIDGRFVGGQTLGSDRWALYGNAGASQGLIFFGDDNGDTAPIYVSSMMFADRRLTPPEILALGGPHALGLATPGPAAPTTAGDARRVGVIGHRGNSGVAPENTLESDRQALALNVLAIEMDIHLSSTGEAVLMHDDTLDRTTDLSGNVNAFTPAQLANADAGSWFDDAYANEPVPTLTQALTLVRNSRSIAYLDIKQRGMAPAIRSAINASGIPLDRVWLWAYDSGYIDELHAAFPTGKIITDASPVTPADFASLRSRGVVGFDWYWGHPALTTAGVAAAQAEGFLVSTYTINDTTTMRAAIDLGVDMMETDYPALLQSILEPCPADFNADGFTDFFDFDDFVLAFESGQPTADFNADGFVDFFDFDDFVAAFEEGC
jgi:glycerophosphoryl diester phosphodiesterase